MKRQVAFREMSGILLCLRLAAAFDNSILSILIIAS